MGAESENRAHSFCPHDFSGSTTMSQTTDQARGKSGVPAPGRKARSARTPRGGSAPRASVPSPPKRRRPALTALAVLLIVGGAALAGAAGHPDGLA